MTANGSAASEMDTVSRSGLMALSTRDNGKIIELTEKVNLSTSTEIFTMVTGSTIRQMAMESTTISMVPCMKDIGEMTFSTVKEKKAGQMARSTRETTWLERSMVSVSTVGTTEASIQATGKRTKSKVLELTVGWMEDSIKENGLIITWTTWVFIPGLMVDATWASTKTIKSTDMVSTNGLTEGSISVNGCEENNMVLEFTKLLKLISNMAYGKKGKESNGSTNIL